MAEKDQAGKTGEERFAGEQVFPTIGDPEAEARMEAEERAAEGRPPEPTRETTPPEPDPDVKTLEQRLAESEERSRRMQATIDRLIAQPSTPAAQPPQEEDDDKDFELPDPVNNPQEFQKALRQQIDTRAERRARKLVGETSRQSGRTQQTGALWNRFQERHEELAKHDLVVEGFVNREMQRLQQLGVDPLQHAATDPDGFVDRIADGVRGYLTEHNVPLGEGGKPSGREADPDAGRGGGNARTTSIDGGSTRTPGGGRKEPEQGSSFVDELRQQQVKSGFF